MIEKVVRKAKLSEFDEIRENLKYWLSKTPQERVEAVETLRRMHYGDELLKPMKKVALIRKLGDDPVEE